ncbi:hypothetical protein DNTS_004802 [Danionella cerebrum]|uniref:Uncharacterized protein n=1 Tax=Danionella cerebrum TaxID=2873325 RepID=A0A553RIV1_9TELE|nr:hypothetical protein DNTS_004802 [Danionella translucida]
MRPSCLSCCVFLLVLHPLDASTVTKLEFEDSESDWGSGFPHLLSSFPADSPFITETPVGSANCSQHFQLPPYPPLMCPRGNPVGLEEFEKSRLLLLQNRAALQEVTSSTGLRSGGATYNQQARDEAKSIKDEYVAVTQTTESIQKVFVELEEKRREGREHYTFSSLKEQIESTTDSIAQRERIAALLEKHAASLETSFNTMKLRLDKLLSQ